MRNEPNRAPGGPRLWLRNNVLGLLAIFIALCGTAVAAQSMGGGSSSEATSAAKKKKKAKPGPQGPQGIQGPAGPATGNAGGALAGNYPNPTLNVSGEPCPNGQELVNVSALAALTCSAGVYSDGQQNVAAGPTSFPDLTTGIANSALGIEALGNNTTGTGNTVVGALALQLNTDGDFNTAVGESALVPNTIGDGNTALGRGALLNTTGSNNVAVGREAGLSLANGNGNIAIGNSGVAGESATIRIGSGHTRAFIDGIRGVTTDAADAIPVLISSTGQLGTISSSRQVKRDIQPLGKLRPLMKLRPVSFRYRSGPPELHYGLIAEQVAKVLPALAVYGSDGLPETVQYQELPTVLLGAIQNQQRQIARQQAQIDRLIRVVGKR